ncbi:MAG TPA: TIGR03118 family protein [Gaiellaceae bacterium]|nr:TIGR03118 family protein [Gaiellaceae bacterium]
MKALAVAVAIAALAAAGSASSARFDRFVGRTVASDRSDRQLVNAWGLAASPTGPWWVANEARASSTLYDGGGRKQALTVRVVGGPTGVVYYGGRGFVVRAGRAAGSARFLYACEDGTIRAWSPVVPDSWSTEAVVAVDDGPTGAVFRGLTIARNRLYVADFHNARVLVYDSRWRPLRRSGAFAEPAIPVWYAPFGIQAVGDRIFVTYAWRAPVDGNDAPTGGYVDEFDLDGRLVARVGNKEELDEPWGVALAPQGFGRFSGDLLVANFGTGAINAYARDGNGWRLHGRLPVKAPGVWGIAFGNGAGAGPRTTLFYAAGPHRWHGATEVDIHGVLGAIRPG